MWEVGAPDREYWEPTPTHVTRSTADSASKPPEALRIAGPTGSTEGEAAVVPGGNQVGLVMSDQTQVAPIAIGSRRIEAPGIASNGFASLGSAESKHLRSSRMLSCAAAIEA